MTEFTAGRFRAVVTYTAPETVVSYVEALDDEGRVDARLHFEPSDIPDLQHVLRRAEQQLEAS